MNTTTTTKALRRAGLVALSALALTSCSAALAASHHATPSAGHGAKTAFDAVILCKTPLTEDMLADPKLVSFERMPEGISIVLRCDEKF